MWRFLPSKLLLLAYLMNRVAGVTAKLGTVSGFINRSIVSRMVRGYPGPDIL